MITTLQVEPLLTYTLPKYPASNEENPLHLPPKQMSKAHFYKTALLGVIGLFSLAPTTQVEAQENPIKFKSLGFPHTYASFGTGMPASLDRETAVSIIDSVFLANDISLKKNYPFSTDEVQFTATAYNDSLDIGYVWLNSENTTNDCYRSWSRYQSEEVPMPPENDPYSKGYYQLLELQKSSLEGSKWYKEVATYLEEHPDKSAPDYGRGILDQYDHCTMSMPEMKKLLKTKDHYVAPFSDISRIMDYNRDWQDRDGDRKGQKVAIKRLETLVQEYINWAKSEGRF